jgi:CxxC-x17-CxxC domain-containing protein
MGNFRDRGFSRDNSGGRARGFGGRDRRSFGRGGREGGRDRRSFGERKEMFDVVCDKCGKECQVPFKPSGEKPVLCSSCFGRKSDSPRNSNFSQQSSGISQEQYKELNAKLDRVLEILENAEFIEEDEEESEEQ